MHIFRLILFFVFWAAQIQTALAGDKIAYAHLTDGYWQIFIQDPSGNDQRQVTFSKYDKRNPTWVNGRTLAYRTNNGQLFVIDIDGQNEKEILSQYRNISNPHFCSRTREVVFVRYDPALVDIGDIWISDIEGARARVIAKYTGLQYQPNISPEGEMVVFVKVDKEDKHSHNLWIMNKDGNNSRQLTFEKGYNTLPVFSLDGKKVIFVSKKEDSDYEIYETDIGNGQMRRLTEDSGLDISPSYSPDGQKIVFVSDRKGNQQLWIMDSDGKNASLLTHDKEESIDPAWGESE